MSPRCLTEIDLKRKGRSVNAKRPFAIRARSIANLHAPQHAVAVTIPNPSARDVAAGPIAIIVGVGPISIVAAVIRSCGCG